MGGAGSGMKAVQSPQGYRKKGTLTTISTWVIQETSSRGGLELPHRAT